MKIKSIIEQLQYERTFGFFILNNLTYGIYGAHYMKHIAFITQQISKQNFSIKPFSVFIISIYVYAILFVFNISLNMINDSTQKINTVALDSLDIIETINQFICGMLYLYTLFSMRSRLNYMLKHEHQVFHHFHWYWTLIFGAIYLNYKMNRIYDSLKSKRTH